MQKNNFLKKGLVIGIIILFVGVAILPGTYANISNLNTVQQKTVSFNINNRGELNRVLFSEEDVVEILITENKPDGSIEQTIVMLPREQVEELSEELKEAREPKEKIAIYKKHELIPQDVSLEQLKIGMLQKTQHLGLTQRKMENLNKLVFPIKNVFSYNTAFNYNCSVYGEITYGMKYLLGLSAFTSWINFLFKLWFIPYRIPSIDLLDIYITEKGILDAVNGSLPDFHTNYGFLIAVIFGFVGYSFVVPPVPGVLLGGEFFGYAAVVGALWFPGRK